MENAIEIRHYVSRAGKDVFDDWLTGLADARTQAKIASESTGSPPETSEIANRCAKDCMSYGSIGGQATGFITR